MVKPPLTPRSENDESTVSTESTVKGNFLPETRTPFQGPVCNPLSYHFIQLSAHRVSCPSMVTLCLVNSPV